MQNYAEQNRMQYFADILILFGMLILCSTVFNYLSLVIVSFSFGLNFQDIIHLIFDLTDPKQILALKVHNTLSAIGTWLLTAVFFVKFKQWDFTRMVAWNPPKHRVVWMPVLVIFASSIVISAYILSFTSQSQFLKDLETKIGAPAIQGAISKMLQMDNLGDLLVNFFFIALVPAVLEEIFFRGVLQNLLMRATGSHHMGIAICSFVFASVHLNPTQFIPMVFLALVLGYVMYYTHSLFCSIAVHFFNNALAVTAFYFQSSSSLAKDIVSDSYTPSLLLVILFAGLTVVGFYLLQNFKSKYHHE